MTRNRKANDFDPTFLDQQYNARASIADVADIFKQWVTRSTFVRANTRCDVDISYTSNAVADPAQTFDYFPNNISVVKPPLLVFIHGGYWRSLDKSDFSFVAPAYTTRGCDVAIINYGLAPAIPLSVICQQTVRAIAYIYSQSDRFGFDPNNITVAGHSAGGHLAAMAFAACWDSVLTANSQQTLPKNLVKKAFALSGLFDLEPIRHVPFLRESVILTKDQATAVSPICFDQPNSGKILTAVGEHESAEFHRQSALLAQAWPDRSPRMQVIAGCNHLTVCNELADANSLTSKALASLIKET